MTEALAARLAELLEQGRSGEALAIAQSAPEQAFADPIARSVWIGRALVAMGRWDEADAALRGGGDETARAALALARARLLADHAPLRARLVVELEQALDSVQKLGAAEPFLQGLGLATRLHVALRNDDLALDRARRLAVSADKLGSGEAAAVARVYAGLAFEARGEPADAERALRDALGLAARGGLEAVRVRALCALARVLARRGHRAVAVEIARELPELDDLEVRAARALYAGVSDERLYEAVSQAFAVEPALAPVYAEVAARAIAAAKPESGLIELERAAAALVRAGSEDLAAALGATRAQLQLRQGATAEALATLEAVTAPAWVTEVLAPLRGEVLFASGRIAEAAALADAVAPGLAARGFDAEAVLALLLASRCYRAGDRLAEAAARVETAAAVDGPDLAGLVQIERAAIALARGEPALGLAELDALLASEPAPALRPSAHTLRAELLVALDRPRDALAELDALPALTPRLEVRALIARYQAQAALGADPASLAALLHDAAERARDGEMTVELARIARLLGASAAGDA